MYLIISVPSETDYRTTDERIGRSMEARGFNFLGVASGSMDCRDLEFENNTPLDDSCLDDMESDLRQLLGENNIRLYVESE